MQKRTTEALNAEFPADGGGRPRVAGLAGDISDPTVAQALVEAARRTFNRLDAVVCNAGIDIIKPAIDYASDEWDTKRSWSVSGKASNCSWLQPAGRCRGFFQTTSRSLGLTRRPSQS